MGSSDEAAFTIVLETTEPFGPEIQVLHEEGGSGREAALRALHHWHGEDFAPTTTIEELEDGSVRVLAVLEGHSDATLVRTPSQKLA
jgi:hypothetical protein